MTKYRLTRLKQISLKIFLFYFSKLHINKAIPIPMSNKDAISKVCNVFVFPFFESQIPNIVSIFLINILFFIYGT